MFLWVWWSFHWNLYLSVVSGIGFPFWFLQSLCWAQTVPYSVKIIYVYFQYLLCLYFHNTEWSNMGKLRYNFLWVRRFWDRPSLIKLTPNNFFYEVKWWSIGYCFDHSTHQVNFNKENMNVAPYANMSLWHGIVIPCFWQQEDTALITQCFCF